MMDPSLWRLSIHYRYTINIHREAIDKWILEKTIGEWVVFIIVCHFGVAREKQELSKCCQLQRCLGGQCQTEAMRRWIHSNTEKTHFCYSVWRCDKIHEVIQPHCGQNSSLVQRNIVISPKIRKIGLFFPFDIKDNPTFCLKNRVIKFKFGCNYMISQPLPNFKTQFLKKRKLVVTTILHWTSELSSFLCPKARIEGKKNKRSIGKVASSRLNGDDCAVSSPSSVRLATCVVR